MVEAEVCAVTPSNAERSVGDRDRLDRAAREARGRGLRFHLIGHEHTRAVERAVHFDEHVRPQRQPVQVELGRRVRAHWLPIDDEARARIERRDQAFELSLLARRDRLCSVSTGDLGGDELSRRPPSFRAPSRRRPRSSEPETVALR